MLLQTVVVKSPLSKRTAVVTQLPKKALADCWAKSVLATVVASLATANLEIAYSVDERKLLLAAALSVAAFKDSADAELRAVELADDHVAVALLNFVELASTLTVEPFLTQLRAPGTVQELLLRTLTRTTPHEVLATSCLRTHHQSDTSI
jgi:hypothetical protein